MADDRSNDAFDTSDLRIGLSQWRAANTEHWGPLISGRQDWAGRSSSTIYTLNKQWLDFLQKRFKEDFALPQRIMSCRTPVELWSAYTVSCKWPLRIIRRNLPSLESFANS